MEIEFKGQIVKIQKYQKEINDEMNINLEDTLDLKEQLISTRENLANTIITDKDDFYG